MHAPLTRSLPALFSKSNPELKGPVLCRTYTGAMFFSLSMSCKKSKGSSGISSRVVGNPELKISSLGSLSASPRVLVGSTSRRSSHGTKPHLRDLSSRSTIMCQESGSLGQDYTTSKLALSGKPDPRSTTAGPSIIAIKEELLSHTDVQNLHILMISSSGKYSTSAIYELLTPPLPTPVPTFSASWAGLHSPRHSFITWLALHNRLVTLDRLHKWGITQNSLFRFCTTANETEDHLFFTCSFTNSVMNTILLWSGIQSRFQHLHDWITWTLIRHNRIIRDPRENVGARGDMKTRLSLILIIFCDWLFYKIEFISLLGFSLQFFPGTLYLNRGV
ncbi:LOW QUALITY PROTEIN: hypothetical protein V2J09_013821 [Rumex salicifolius]